MIDYEKEPEKQTFHPEHLKEGVHFEHDGFTEKKMRSWFIEGNEDTGKVKWDLTELRVTKIPVLKPVDPDYADLDPPRKEEVYNLLMATCVVT